MEKGVAFQQLCAAMPLYPLCGKIHTVFMCKKKRFNEALGGGMARRQTLLFASCLEEAQTVNDSPGACDTGITPSITAGTPCQPCQLSSSISVPKCHLRAAGASCQPWITTEPAPGLRVFRQPVHMESSVLAAPFEFWVGRRRINKFQADRQSRTSLNKNSKPWALHYPFVRHHHKCL